MKEVLQVADQYYVLATSLLADHETRILKDGECFAIFDPRGDVQPVTHAEAGVFYRGTRYLSKYAFAIAEDLRPLLLNSILRDDNGVLKVDMTNPDLSVGDVGFVPKGTLHIHREKFVLRSQCFEKITVHNYGSEKLVLDAVLTVDADFKDIFEVRGNQRLRRGETRSPRVEGGELIIEYDGLDGLSRATRVGIEGVACAWEGQRAAFQIDVPAHERLEFKIVLSFSESGAEAKLVDFDRAQASISGDHERGKSRFCSVKTSNEQFEAWMKRSTDDLVMMTTATPEGHLYPYAGIPWFCAAFGRDGILAAMECLWANPELSRGVLLYLAQTQAAEHDPARDSTPGKIIHEVRFGEMAALKEVPFGRYYGSIDSTPLFICLAGQYLERTNDVDLIRDIWPNIERALDWMVHFGDRDRDGFIEYVRENPNGLIHQGWKDSTDSVFHEDGSEALAPIALCEVQGYAYMAYLEAAKMARVMGHMDHVQELERKAHDLKENFDRAFWLDDLGTYALALDGAKRPCRVMSSNAGQCLFTGIVKRERVTRLVKSIMNPETFSGWGVRTISSRERRYNPMSYHNGSVWPHDSALVAWGLAKAGHKNEAERLFTGLFRSAIYMDLHRLPEVFCGFSRKEGEAPTLYPNACSPQAWASAAVYLLVQSMLGLSIHAAEKRVCFRNPRLPSSIETLKISQLKVGSATLDLLIQNYHSDVSVQILHRQGDVMVAVEK